MRSASIVVLIALLALASTGCPPAPPPVNTTPTVQQSSVDPLQTRMEEAFRQIRARQLDPSHGFWTVFHGILGLGSDLDLYDPQTQKPMMKALDYIRLGKPMKGLRFDVRGNGLDVFTASDIDVFFAQGHQDQFVAEMAQWGVSKNLPFNVDGKDFTFADFIQYTKQRACVTRKQELAWALLVIAEYEGTKLNWTNQFNETLTVEDIVKYELESPLDPEDAIKIGQLPLACGGTHRLFGLSWALHRHLQDGGKLTGIWKTTHEKLDSLKKTVLNTRLSTTGHTFEWLVIALDDNEIKEPWVEQAASYLTQLVLDLQKEPIDGGSLYHAVHGLLIYYARVYGTEALGPNTPYVRLAPSCKPIPWKPLPSTETTAQADAIATAAISSAPEK